MMVLAAWLSLCVCIHGNAHSGQWFHSETLLSCLWCIKREFILSFSHTYSHTRRGSHTEEVSWSSISTWHPRAVMFSFGADGMRYISLTDSIHSSRRPPPLLSLHQPPLLYLSICLCQTWSLFLSYCLCFSFWRMRLIGKPLITTKTMVKKSKYTVSNMMT